MKVFLGLIIVFHSSLSGILAQAQWNHLRRETSSYLRQHVHNPVDWYPWNEIALNKARTENKLLIISIGYASCHWCHVMESESFSDTAVSRSMNDSYVSIKVDREERPDIDQIYLTACQLVNHDGCGWPLNVIALPDGRPVYITTYLKKPQWMEVIQHFAKQYREGPDKMKLYADQLIRGVQSNSFILRDQDPSIPDSVVHLQVKSFIASLDSKLGGIPGSSKFPLPAMFDFILSYGKKYNHKESIQSVYTLLDHLMTGGIYDMLEGGFGRYSTDEDWNVPHFEKMLYDNAQLISLYAHAYQLSKNERYKSMLKSCIDFLNQLLKAPDGAYYSSYDADAAEHQDPALREGQYYLWTKDEINDALGDPSLIEKCNNWFNILDEGNALSNQQYSMLGKNVLSFQRLNSGEVYPPDFSDSIFSMIRSKLLAARLKRIRPARDEKIICSWNALAISGLADAYMATGERSFRSQALSTGNFIWKKMHQSHALMRIYQTNKIISPGFLDDYAYTGLAFVKLYQITFDERWLKRSVELKEEALARYGSDSIALLYYTSKGEDPLIAKQMDIVDREIPSSNAALARLLMILSEYYFNPKDSKRADDMVKSMTKEISAGTANQFYYWLENALLLHSSPYEIAIVGNEYEKLRHQLATHFIPYTLWCGGAKEGHLPLLKSKLQKGETMIYVCQHNLCLLPVREVDQALLLINP